MTADGEIQFGDLEESVPRTQLRPDRNRHFIVGLVGQARDDDLPIFIDLDVMRDMERHATSDTRVELGGVVLGGQYVDEQQTPFVFVTDSLRAAHYEATKGSFKFTHDTWQQISRQREEFPAETEMVGWYHTHPDWGVFLSGMDMFICEHFFNRKLDIAIVIDPCRAERGVFFWDPMRPGEIRRASSYYLVTSRFRAAELDQYVAELEEGTGMRASGTVPYATGQPAPIIQVSEPQNAWLMAGMLGVLAVQLGVLLLLAWKVTTPPTTAERSESQLAASVQEWLEEDRERHVGEAAVNAKLQVLDQLLGQIEGAPINPATRLAEQQEKVEQLQAALAGLAAGHRDVSQQLAAKQEQYDKLVNDSEYRESKLKKELRSVSIALDNTKSRLAELRVASGLDEPEEDDAQNAAGRLAWLSPRNWNASMWVAVLLVLVVITLIAAALTIRRRPLSEYTD